MTWMEVFSVSGVGSGFILWLVRRNRIFIAQCEKFKKTRENIRQEDYATDLRNIRVKISLPDSMHLPEKHLRKQPSEDGMTDNQQPISEFKSKSGLKRILGAFGYSIEGFRAAWRGEHAFRQELALVVTTSIIALLLPVTPLEKLMLIGVFVLVLIVELLNSAIEAVVDRVSLERNPLSKNAKDFGSAAVFLTLSLAVATWAVIVLPLLMDKTQG